MSEAHLLQDIFTRRFHYVRLSITDKCNFRCQYCLPNGYECKSPQKSLSLSEINHLLAALVELGIQKIRLTGGEPLLRKDLVAIIKTIKQYPQINSIALTTNAYKLHHILDECIDAGLTHLNISVDSLDEDNFADITGSNKLKTILNTIDYALGSSLQQVKINTVLLKNTFAELGQFLSLIKKQPLDIRFIELMETGDNQQFFQENYLAAHILQDELLAQNWQAVIAPENSGPAKMFAHPEYNGKIGIIAPYSKDFCTNCNRLRFTHLGALRLCLFGDDSFSLRHLMQDATQKEDLKSAIINLLVNKPKQHLLSKNIHGDVINFSQIGG